MLIHVPLKTPFSCAIYQRKDPALRLSFPFCSFAKNPVASSGKGHPSRKNHSFSSMTVYKYKFIKFLLSENTYNPFPLLDRYSRELLRSATYLPHSFV